MASEPGDDALLTEARERMRLCIQAEDKRRARQLFDYKFSLGKISGEGKGESFQWSQDDQQLRAGRPMLTNNRVGPHCRQTVNQIRQARQAVKVNPVDSGADPEKAAVRQGVIRRIESRSNADSHYMVAADQQVRMGEAFVRVLPKYVDPKDGPEQELVIAAIRNRFSVYVDPSTQEYDGSDANYAFITEHLTDDAYALQHKDSEIVGVTDFQGLGDDKPVWFPTGGKLVAEYFYVKRTFRKVTLQDRDGKPNEQTLEDRQVCWVKMNGVEVLERQELPIPWIPIARAVGEAVNLEGEVDFRGAVRDAIDPQKQLNYMDSAAAETIAFTSKAPWVMAEGQDEGYRDMWREANNKAWPYLLYKPKTHNGELLPPPQRNVAGADIQAFVIAAARAENNLRASLGIVDIDQQERAKEQSGKAIVARQRQNELGNSHFAENHALMIRHVGRILDAWLPFIYDAPRTMEITGADETKQTVMVHAGMPPSAPPADDVKVYDLKVGRYDIEISVGPSYQTRRQEAVDMMTQVITAKPELLQFMGDLYFGNMDWPEAQQIGERFKKMLPPELQDDKKQDIPPQVQQQLQQQSQMIELLTKELDARVKQIETDEVKAKQQIEIKKLDVAASLKLQQMQDATTLRVKEIDALTKGFLLDQEQQHEALALNQAQRHEAALAGAGADEERDASARAHQQTLEQGEQGHQQAIEQSELGHQQALEQGEQSTQGAIAVQAAKPTPKAGKA